MLKGNRLLRNIFRKHFEEKYKHTKVALNFVLKQCFSQKKKKTHFIVILVNLLYRDQIVSYNRFHNILRLFDVLPNFPFTTSETMLYTIL